MQCDMCGSEGRLVRAMIEGTELKVCGNCAKFGKVLGPVREERIEIKKLRKVEIIEEPEVMEVVIPDFSSVIRKKRESLGLNQEEFAKKLSEKESIVHKMETGEFTPSISTARKLERMLGIRLVEEHTEEHKKVKAGGTSEGMTIGDLIKIKKR